MNKRIKVFFTVAVFLLISLICTNVKAASTSISASPTTITVGKSSTVTVTIKAAAWSVKVSGSASGNITGYSANEKNVTTTKKYTVKPSKAGKYTVTISGDATDANGKEINVNKSVTITVKNKTNNNDNSNNNNNNNNSNNTDNTSNKKSTDATLSNLGVTPSKYDFSGFKKAVTGANAEYKVKVPNDVTKLTVYATTSDKKATYSVSGNTGFKVGTNVISVKVTAEDKKTTKTYKIYVTREAEDEEITPNVIEDEKEEEQEPEDGIGLKSLKVDGYELDEKFSTTLLDYNVEVGRDKLTVAELRNKIEAKVNYSKAKTSIEIEEGEESDYYRYIATITVKDDTKEYAVYTLRFVESLEMAKEVAEEENTMPEDVEAQEKENSKNKKELWFGHDKDLVQKVMLIVLCIVLFIICIILAIKNKNKSEIIRDYEDDDYDDMSNINKEQEHLVQEDPITEEKNLEENNMSDEEAVLRHFGVIQSNKTAEKIEDEKFEDEEIKEEVQDENITNEPEEKYVPKFRNPRSRNSRKGGRHF